MIGHWVVHNKTLVLLYRIPYSQYPTIPYTYHNTLTKTFPYIYTSIFMQVSAQRKLVQAAERVSDSVRAEKDDLSAKVST